jgi:hypothetical protein
VRIGRGARRGEEGAEHRRSGWVTGAGDAAAGVAYRSRRWAGVAVARERGALSRVDEGAKKFQAFPRWRARKSS